MIFKNAERRLSEQMEEAQRVLNAQMAAAQARLNIPMISMSPLTAYPKPLPEPAISETDVELSGWRHWTLNVKPLGGTLEPLVALEGFRSWRVDARITSSARCDGSSGLLTPPPGVPYIPGPSGHHKVPGFHCGCGHYALNVPPAFLAPDAIIGRVSAMGRTIVHAEGFRCAQYRIEEMYIRPYLKPLKARLEDQFEVPVFVAHPSDFPFTIKEAK